MVWSMQKRKPKRASKNRLDKKCGQNQDCFACGSENGMDWAAIPAGASWCTVSARPFPWAGPAHLCFIDLLLLCGIYCGIRRQTFSAPISCCPKSRQNSSRVPGNGRGWRWLNYFRGRGPGHKPLKLVGLFLGQFFCFVFIFVPSFGFRRL